MREKGRLIFSILIFAGILALLIRWMPSIGAIVTTSPSAPMDADEFVGDNVISSDGDFESVTISKETVTALLSSYRTPTNLDMDLTYTLSAADGSSLTQRINYTKRSARETVRCYSDSQRLQTTYTISSSGISVSDSISGENYTLPSDGVFSARSLMHMPELDWFYSSSSGNVRDLHFTTIDDRDAIYIEYFYPRLSQVEKYWVSTDYGVILRSETSQNGRTYITVNVTDIS